MKLLGWTQLDPDGSQHFGFGITNVFQGEDLAWNVTFANPNNYTVDVILPRVTVKEFDLALAAPPYSSIILGSHMDAEVSANFGVFEGISIHDFANSIFLEVWVIEPNDSFSYPL